MADEVKKLLSEYIAEHRAGGEADPLEYLERVNGANRGELAALIDGYLARSPGREWDPDAYKGSAAEHVALAFGQSLAGKSGWWPAILPRLRDQARITRAQVVERLSAALGVADRQDKVAAYYHQMEHGSLDSTRVSARVLDALGEIYGTTAAKLREIGDPLGEGHGPAGAPAMARTAPADAHFKRPDLDLVPEGERDELRDEPVAPAERDEIDEMFTGGP